jgi:hypothetical protein
LNWEGAIGFATGLCPIASGLDAYAIAPQTQFNKELETDLLF